MARKGRPEPPMGVLRRLDAGARAGFPALFTGLLIAVAAVPVGVPGLAAAIALPPVFFWTVFRPAAMPAPAVFALGLLLDLVSFAPLGIGVLTLLVAHGVAMRLRDWVVKQSFLLVWLVFCLFAIATAALGFLLHALLMLQVPPRMPAVLQAGMAAGIYPLLGWALARLHMAMTRAEEAA